MAVAPRPPTVVPTGSMLSRTAPGKSSPVVLSPLFALHVVLCGIDGCSRLAGRSRAWLARRLGDGTPPQAALPRNPARATRGLGPKRTPLLLVDPIG